MTFIYLDNTKDNLRFKIMNIILNHRELFDLEKLVLKLGEEHTIQIEDCIRELIDYGHIYEIGRRYKVKESYIK